MRRSQSRRRQRIDRGEARRDGLPALPDVPSQAELFGPAGGNRKRRPSAFAGRHPSPKPQMREHLRAVEAAEPAALDNNFNFAHGNGRRHAEFGPDSKAFADCGGDVCLRLRSALAHASRNGRAFGYVHTVFITIDTHCELQSWMADRGTAIDDSHYT